MRNVLLHDWGLIKYLDGFEKQEKLFNLMVDFKIKNQKFNPQDHLVFCEHYPVYTLGKGGNINNVLISGPEMEQQNIEFYHSNRGGDVTFHGLDQLVIYPIFDLEAHKADIGLYIRNLEEVIIRVLKHFNIVGGRNIGESGVWVEAGIKNKERKICAIGVRCSRWVTMHGLAFNVNTDLKYFDKIIPCGIENKKITSLEIEMKKKIDMCYVKKIVLQEFKVIFNIKLNS